MKGLTLRAKDNLYGRAGADSNMDCLVCSMLPTLMTLLGERCVRTHVHLTGASTCQHLHSCMSRRSWPQEPSC